MKSNIIKLKESTKAQTTPSTQEDTVHIAAKKAAKYARKAYDETAAAIFFSPWRQKSKFA